MLSIEVSYDDATIFIKARNSIRDSCFFIEGPILTGK